LFALLAAAAFPARGAETYDGTPVGFTEDGYPYRGKPDAAVTITEYSDYLCPYCARHFQQTLPALLEKYVRPGKVKFVFADFPIASLHPQAPAAAESALCVAEQGAALFWAMHDKIFESRNRWAQASPDDLLPELAASVGADMTAYQACVQSGRQKDRVDAAIAAAQELGFNATPSFRFQSDLDEENYTFAGAQSIDKFSEWLDAMLAGEPPPVPPPPELPFWASEEGLAPDPDRPGFTRAGDAYKGNPDAPLVVVEFSDFQCPSCQRHSLETQPVLDEKFIDTGKVLWVFKNRPLRIHENAPAAAVAAECAGEQGKFWEMAQLLYQNSDAWSEGDPDFPLLAMAEELGLDEIDFRVCFQGRKGLERVLDDIYDGIGIISETPSFVTIYGGRGRLSKGAREPEHFVTYLEKAFENATKPQ
jgi:protein-disulfide isomerase